MTTWYPICPWEALPLACGVPALLAAGPVALFRTSDDELYAVGGVDPFCGAGVISRGIVGDRGGEPTVASPMLKQVFSLRTGACLDDPAARLPTFPVRRRGGVVEVGLP
ncbi:MULTISPECIES: nitrite reductase small subunit NirD [unclassified Saccharopolyspora]|uniref:nitrite reductase small subunit NirD n=1 Tax=unclassified Saccharopolyspora TaxID=2646250 RepID=UPI001CD2D065|nr:MULTISPECIES: nitrite reductase small subunit NirD [unclassified Saccharopolyspora]MCA1185584.1 nitrite reductase small subunit NirD [Saccharopolyspora sp. 6T]MCA1280802.1 nitrite reductase small subunit NirD [Saccharopolyspora sp. 7B]